MSLSSCKSLGAALLLSRWLNLDQQFAIFYLVAWNDIHGFHRAGHGCRQIVDEFHGFHDDGRLTIADGGRRLTGWPVARALRGTLSALAVTLLALGAAPAKVQAETLLNVSYDPTRELYRELNESFVAFWTAQGNLLSGTIRDGPRRPPRLT